ncbi:LLM class flavin-dependent oxidoreductase [Luteipulveratus sp. YIM 133132]|uniref:LLM class flavin-dependent oxidoreductase n=1 Tax=Luteipulveratus flavus TaxID=3031728 RepID=UPI0023B04DEA|nr:LLM class flavin-dependent oxidoreductase [Luteipulveratus sp. YIM 133132]MDE9364926.1 LLM class flavin-dependent oxidoreductase [Luteipulveratus sp. YIM 133132]
MPTYSVIFPQAPLRIHELVRYADLVEATGAQRLWQGQTLAVDPHTAFAAVAGAGRRIPLGTAVTLMAQRHPAEAALQARTLARLTGCSVVAGVGPGGAEYQRRFLPEAYPRVLRASREYVRTMRVLLDGGVPGHGADFHADHAIAPLTSPAVEIGLGVLREGMAGVAGEVADVALTWLAPPAYLRERLVPAVARGARRRGREKPRVVALVPVVLAGPGRDPERYLLAGNGGHLSQPHYRTMLQQAGVALPDGLKGCAGPMTHAGAFVFGDDADVRRAMAAYAQAGVDEVVLSLAAVHHLEGCDSALEDLAHLLRLLAPADQPSRSVSSTR